jgi:anti-sigma regulatory factor (Ser/Thr protein kinase)
MRRPGAIVSGLRRPESAGDDEGAEVVGWPDLSASHLGRLTSAGRALQPATSAASGWPGDASHDGGPAGRRRHWRLPATERSVTVLRRALDAFFALADLSDDERYDLLLVACEAASNAIEHASNPTEPFFEVTAEIGHARITIVVCDHGQWRDAPAGAHRGRGLRMMWLLADTTVAAGRHGTTVTIRSSPRHGRHPAAHDGERGAGNGSRISPSGTG